LEYVEASNEDTAKKSKGNLVKHIHERVEKIKRDVTMEVEFMTLLQRDKEKIEEGREQGREEGIAEAIEKMLRKNVKKETISELLEVDLKLVEEIASGIK
ncbi:MAG: Rpn family recombination-promoting nuclease/putative transposase, partial [Clostridium sp.]